MSRVARVAAIAATSITIVGPTLQQTQLASRVPRQIELAAFRVKTSDAGAPCRQVERAVLDTEPRHRYRRSRAVGQRQLFHGQASLIDVELHAAGGSTHVQAKAQLDTVRVHLQRRPAGQSQRHPVKRDRSAGQADVELAVGVGVVVGQGSRQPPLCQRYPRQRLQIRRQPRQGDIAQHQRAAAAQGSKTGPSLPVELAAAPGIGAQRVVAVLVRQRAQVAQFEGDRRVSVVVAGMAVVQRQLALLQHEVLDHQARRWCRRLFGAVAVEGVDQAREVERAILVDRQLRRRRHDAHLGQGPGPAQQRAPLQLHRQRPHREQRRAIGFGQHQVLRFEAQGERIEPQRAHAGLALETAFGQLGQLRLEHLRQHPAARRRVQPHRASHTQAPPLPPFAHRPLIYTKLQQPALYSLPGAIDQQAAGTGGESDVMTGTVAPAESAK